MWNFSNNGFKTKLFIFCVIISVLIGSAISGIDELDRYYGNSFEGEMILSAIDQDPNLLRNIEDYNLLFDKMLQHDGMYSIAGTILGYKINQLQNKDIQNDILDHIMANLLPEIKHIPWDVTVKLFNVGFNKYLCSSNDLHVGDRSFYKVYTLSAFDENNCYWRLKVAESGDFFTIQNTVNKRYLFAAGNAFDMDNNRRRIFTVANTSTAHTGDKWQLDPSRDIQLGYRIKNLFYNEYIYNLNDKYDRDVIAWKPLGCDGNACIWKILKGPSELPEERKNFLLECYNQYQGSVNVADHLMKLALQSQTQIIEFHNLYDLMKKHNGLHSTVGMRLDYNVQKLLKENPNDTDLLYIEEKFRKEWNKFPWNNRILIRNKSYQRFLCPTTEMFNGTNFRMGYTLSDRTSCHWKIEADPSGQFFQLKSISVDQYLVAAPNEFNFDAARRRVFITNSNENSLNEMKLWHFEHARERDHMVRIVSAFWNEYLYNFNDGKLDRDLFTWRPFGCDGNACLWQIIDAGTP